MFINLPQSQRGKVIFLLSNLFIDATWSGYEDLELNHALLGCGGFP